MFSGSWDLPTDGIGSARRGSVFATDARSYPSKRRTTGGVGQAVSSKRGVPVADRDPVTRERPSLATESRCALITTMKRSSSPYPRHAERIEARIPIGIGYQYGCDYSKRRLQFCIRRAQFDEIRQDWLTIASLTSLALNGYTLPTRVGSLIKMVLSQQTEVRRRCFATRAPGPCHSCRLVNPSAGELRREWDRNRTAHRRTRGLR